MSNTAIAPFKTLLIYNAQNPSLIIHVALKKIKELKITIPFGTTQKDLVLQPIEIENIHKTRAFHYQINKDELSIKSLESGGEILTKIEITNLKLNPDRVNASISIQNENETYILPIENYNAFVNSFYASTTDSAPKNLFEATDVDDIQLNWNGHKDCTYELVINDKTINNVVGFIYKVSSEDLEFKNICQLKAKYKGQPNVEIIKQWAFEIKKPDLSKITLEVKDPISIANNRTTHKYFEEGYKFIGSNWIWLRALDFIYLDMTMLEKSEKDMINEVYLNHNLVYKKELTLKSYNINEPIKINKSSIGLFSTKNQFTFQFYKPNLKPEKNNVKCLGVFRIRDHYSNFFKGKSPFLNNKRHKGRIHEIKFVDIKNMDQEKFCLNFDNDLNGLEGLLEIYSLSINDENLYSLNIYQANKVSFKEAYESNYNNIKDIIKLEKHYSNSPELNYSILYLNFKGAKLFFESLNTIKIKFRLLTSEKVIYTHTVSFLGR